MPFRKIATVFFVLIFSTTVAFPVYALTDLGQANSLDGVRTDQATFFGFGKVNSLREVGMYYRPGASHNICQVNFLLDASSVNVNDAVRLELRIGTTTSGGGSLASQGTLVDRADADVQIRNTTFQKTTFTFTPCAIVVGAYDYFFVLYRDGALNDTNFYNIIISDGVAPTYNGTGVKSIFLGNNTGTISKSMCGNIACTDLAIIGTENYGATSPSSTPSFAQSVIDEVLGINDTTASSSLEAKFAQFWSLQTYLETKFPFNYYFEIATDLGIFSESTTTTFYNWSISFPVTGSSTGFQVLPSSWTFMSTSTISTYYPDSIRLFFRNIVGVMVTLAWAFYMWRRLSGIFSRT